VSASVWEAGAQRQREGRCPAGPRTAPNLTLSPRFLFIHPSLPLSPLPLPRAYKLGKRRWSYNQCELAIVREGGGPGIEVVEAVQYAVPSLHPHHHHHHHHHPPGVPLPYAAGAAGSLLEGSGNPLEDASVTYQVRLANGQRLRVVVYVVYDAAQPVRAKPGAGGGGPGGGPPSAGAAASASAAPAPADKTFYQWQAVARAACRKCCTGPVLRSIQRFGRLGRRSGVPGEAGSASPGNPAAKGGPTTAAPPPLPGSASPGGPLDTQQVKEARFLYLSIDEAGTHVGARAFRFVLGAYDAAGTALLGSSVSPPIRVLANNDVPTGAAFIQLTLPLRSDWAGWSAAPAAGSGLESGSGRSRARGGGSAPAPGITPPARVALAARAAAAAGAAAGSAPGARPAVMSGVPAAPGSARPAARRPTGGAAPTSTTTGGGGGAQPAPVPTPPAGGGLASLLLSHAVAYSLNRDPAAAATAAAAPAGGTKRPSPLGLATGDGGGGLKRPRASVEITAATGGPPAPAPPPPPPQPQQQPPLMVASSQPTPGGGVLHTLCPYGVALPPLNVPPPSGLLRTASGAGGPAGTGSGGSGSLLLLAALNNSGAGGGGGGGGSTTAPLDPGASTVALSPLWRSGSFGGVLAAATGFAGSGAWALPALSGGGGGGGGGSGGGGGGGGAAGATNTGMSVDGGLTLARPGSAAAPPPAAA